MTEFVEPFPGGRTLTRERRVRLGDADLEGRLRLDALARYLQDVASDDSRDAAFEGTGGVWVVRRTVVRVDVRPRLDDEIALTTFLGGVGPRWAERRTTVRDLETDASGGAERGQAVAEAAALWVYVDRTSGFPKPVPDGFIDVWGDAGRRKVSGRLAHANPPEPDGPAAAVARRPWAVRATDFDMLGHVNNAAYWEVVEDELSRRGVAGTGGVFELEYRLPVEPHHEVELLVAGGEGDAFDVWIVGDAGVHATARVVPFPP